jgi:hypothetical protein
MRLRGLILPVLTGMALALAGCGGPDPVGPTVPVAGRVTVEDKPVPTGNLVLKPDAAKGNTTRYEPVAFINADGTYRVKTADKDGAPVGWYKVAIESSEPITDVVATGTVPKSFINKKYNLETTSGLTIEVRADAPGGAYDFKLTK